MCGIAGILSSQHQSVIHPMTEALTHRGPDGEGYYSDDAIALGHRRLSIVDVEGGRQPIASPDDRLQLICNGEIYNSPALRERYAMAGYPFRTRTDVEVILPLYLEHGLNCVRELQGMFAFAIWDSREHSLFLARDHMGQKPLFFARAGNDFLFASEVKAILAAGLIDPGPDLDALWHYISLRYVPADQSLFAGIHKLKAGHVAHVTADGIDVRQYWSLNFGPKFTGSERELTNELDARLNATVKAHLLSDVEVGSSLSGGIDSSTVSAVAARHKPGPLSTFSIGVRDEGFNELPFARIAAAHCGFQAHERVVEADLVSLMPAMIHAMDEPADPFGVGVYLLSSLASQHVKVALSGDGGDETFAGYDRYAGQRLTDVYSLLPAPLRRHLVSRLVGLIPDSFGYNTYAQKARWLNEMSFHTSGNRYAHSMSFLRFTESAKQSLFTAEARHTLQATDSAEKILAYFDADNAEHLVDRMLYTDLMTRMPDHLLTTCDRMSMAHSLELRPVLIDYKLTEFAARLPPRMKLRGRELKYLLKRVAGRYLPARLVSRPKRGFSFPIGRWLRTDLKNYATRLLAQSRFVQAGIFEPDYIARLLREHVTGATDHSYRLWILINLELWHRLYFEGASVADIQAMSEELLHA
ncbi:MAG: asparagine synthase (glutamine-hydrolyzing) [Pseudomonadota bacterium]